MTGTSTQLFFIQATSANNHKLRINMFTTVFSRLQQHLVSKRRSMRNQGRELASLVQTRSKQTGNLLDDRVGGHKEMEFLGQLLDKLLVLVELLEILNRTLLHIDRLQRVQD